jgi:hypothetical protein
LRLKNRLLIRHFQLQVVLYFVVSSLPTIHSLDALFPRLYTPICRSMGSIRDFCSFMMSRCRYFAVRERVYIVEGSRGRTRQLKEGKHSGAESNSSNRLAWPAALSISLNDRDEMHIPNNYPRVWRGKNSSSRLDRLVQGNKIDKSRGSGNHKHGCM